MSEESRYDFFRLFDQHIDGVIGEILMLVEVMGGSEETIKARKNTVRQAINRRREAMRIDFDSELYSKGIPSIFYDGDSTTTLLRSIRSIVDQYKMTLVSHFEDGSKSVITSMAAIDEMQMELERLLQGSTD